MAIRRESVYRQNLWVIQDFLDFEDGLEQLRYLLVKYDGEPFEKVYETVDQEDSLKGGNIVARLDYSIIGKLVTIDHWEVFWRDEWPLRLAVQYLTNCLYADRYGFSTRVDKEAYSFWVSEHFTPTSNDPLDYLLQNGDS
jgi:hypothetical protein